MEISLLLCGKLNAPAAREFPPGKPDTGLAKRFQKTGVFQRADNSPGALAVQVYEIRVMPEQPRSPDIYASSHIDDHAAIRRAIALAKPGQAVEVWCGARCVYSGTPPKPAIH